MKDISGAGNDGVLMNGSELLSGIIGQALQRDGVDGYLDAGLGRPLNYLPTLSVSAWIYPRTANGGEHIPGKGGSSKIGWLIILETNTRLRFLAYSTEGVLEQTSDHNVILTNSWQHILGYCWRTYFHLLRLTFLHRHLPGLVPPKKPGAKLNFRLCRVRQQYLLVTWDGSATGKSAKIYVNGSEIAYDATFDAHGSRQSDAGHH